MRFLEENPDVIRIIAEDPNIISNADVMNRINELREEYRTPPSMPSSLDNSWESETNISPTPDNTGRGNKNKNKKNKNKTKKCCPKKCCSKKCHYKRCRSKKCCSKKSINKKCRSKKCRSKKCCAKK